MRLETCEECRSLFEEYRSALMQCIKLDGQLRLASLSTDLQAMDSCSDALADANSRRDALRQAVRNHEMTTHPDSPPLHSSAESV